MKKIALALLTGTALSAPAMACTDWKAVAAFDAIIAANDKIAVDYETTMQDTNQCIAFRNGKIEFGDVKKWPKGTAAYRMAQDSCSGASTKASSDAYDVISHRNAALADTCGESK